MTETELPMWQENRSVSPIRNQEVEHASWCKANHHAQMLDARRAVAHAKHPLLDGELQALVLERLTEAGYDVMKVVIRHPGYGPEIYLRSCEVRLYAELQNKLFNAADHVIPKTTQMADPTSDSWWYDSARRALEWLAQTETPFDAYDLTEMGVPDPDHPNRWGSLFRVAKDEGLITPVGYRESRRPSRAGGVCRVWVGKEKAA